MNKKLSVRQGYQVQVPSEDGIILVDSEKFYSHERKFFVGEDGIRHGHEEFSKMIIPKEVFIEAYKRYIEGGE